MKRLILPSLWSELLQLAVDNGICEQVEIKEHNDDEENVGTEGETTGDVLCELAF